MSGRRQENLNSESSVVKLLDRINQWIYPLAQGCFSFHFFSSELVYSFDKTPGHLADGQNLIKTSSISAAHTFSFSKGRELLSDSRNTNSSIPSLNETSQYNDSFILCKFLPLSWWLVFEACSWGRPVNKLLFVSQSFPEDFGAYGLESSRVLHSSNYKRVHSRLQVEEAIESGEGSILISNDTQGRYSDSDDDTDFSEEG